jgi:hypothetical protein
MKTVKEWFEELPEPYKSKALLCIQEQERYKESNWECGKMSAAIYHGFSWALSDQKGDYWNNLYYHFIEKERQNEIYLSETMKILDYLKNLPNDVRAEAIANYDENYINKWLPENNPKDLSDALENAFDWSKTMEGHKFWEEVWVRLSFRNALTNKKIALKLFEIFFPLSKDENIQNYEDTWIDETIDTSIRVVKVNDEQVVVTVTNRKTGEINTYLNIHKCEFEALTNFYQSDNIKNL